MANAGMIGLLNFIGYGLNLSPAMTEYANYTLITAEGMGFAIHYYTDVSQGTIAGSGEKTIHISEDQLRRDAKKIYNRLKVQAGRAEKVYARSTVAVRIDKRIALGFLKDHHLQVALPGKYRYGLYHQGELVSLAVFSGGRRMHNKTEDYRSFELIRFCHKSDIVVIGGLSKLIQAFIKDFKPSDIMTYVDADWTQDSSLQKIGFEVDKTLPGQRFWITPNQQIPILADEELSALKEKYPEGYLHYSSGSTKLILSL